MMYHSKNFNTRPENYCCMEQDMFFVKSGLTHRIVEKHFILRYRGRNTCFCIYELTSKPIFRPSKPVFGRDFLSKPTFNVPSRNFRPIQTKNLLLCTLTLNQGYNTTIYSDKSNHPHHRKNSAGQLWICLIGSHPPMMDFHNVQSWFPKLE